MITNYEYFLPKQVRHRQESYDINALFKKPLLHRQIKGEEVYVPLDTNRLWGH